MADVSLAGKTVVVTGAAGGIGAATCARLSEDGVRVVGVDLKPSAGQVSLELDLGDIDSLKLVVDAVRDSPLVGVVNNAALSSSVPTSEVDSSLWERLLAVNLRAPFFLAEMLVEQLHENAGSVINVASVHAFATSRGAVPYAASKGGLVALTRAQAVDWSARQLRVRSNCVVPGAIQTDMLTDGLLRTRVKPQELASRHLTGTLGTPAEVAELIYFLLSPNSHFINGTTLVIDGGALAQLSTENR